MTVPIGSIASRREGAVDGRDGEKTEACRLKSHVNHMRFFLVVATIV